MACGPLRIPLAGEMGPSYAGGAAAGSVPAARAPFHWEAHPVALVLVLIFVVILARKAMS